jgi:phosphatidylinositol glycan class Z
LIALIFGGLFTTFIAVYLDTQFYSQQSVTWSHLFTNPTITPLNNLMYNLSSTNLAQHGLHPWYQHAFVNLPQLIGPASILLFVQPYLSLRLYSALSGVVVLSLFQHQEARFLLPTIPLILSSVQLPQTPRFLKAWTAVWVLFNVSLGILMGVYHQGGVVPMQEFFSQRADAAHVIWWKTYSPPIWLLQGKYEGLNTYDVMGMKGDLMLEKLRQLAPCHEPSLENQKGTYLVAPTSATFLDPYISGSDNSTLHFEEIWKYSRHLNLDDLDFGDDGVWQTLERVVGRRGLSTWKVTKDC